MPFLTKLNGLPWLCRLQQAEISAGGPANAFVQWFVSAPCVARLAAANSWAKLLIVQPDATLRIVRPVLPNYLL